MLNPTQFQAKEEKVKAVDDSLSEASSSLSEWETLEEDNSEICAPSEDVVSSRT